MSKRRRRPSRREIKMARTALVVVCLIALGLGAYIVNWYGQRARIRSDSARYREMYTGLSNTPVPNPFTPPPEGEGAALPAAAPGEDGPVMAEVPVMAEPSPAVPATAEVPDVNVTSPDVAVAEDGPVMAEALPADGAASQDAALMAEAASVAAATPTAAGDVPFNSSPATAEPSPAVPASTVPATAEPSPAAPASTVPVAPDCSSTAEAAVNGPAGAEPSSIAAVAEDGPVMAEASRAALALASRATPATAEVPDVDESSPAVPATAEVPDVDESSPAIPATAEVPVIAEASPALAAAAETPVPADAQTQEPIIMALPTAPPTQLSFAELLRHNPDTVGFLDVPDVVSLPVVQRIDDNDYYLSHSYEQQSADEGALFLDGYNRLVPEDDCLIIYGHNMKNDTMFGRLNEYGMLSFMKAHPVLRFDTIYENRAYVPFAAFAASMDSRSRNYFEVRALLMNPGALDAFVQQVRRRTAFEIPVDVIWGDRVLLLVTCDYTNPEGRFILCLRQLRADETEEGVAAAMQGARMK